MPQKLTDMIIDEISLVDDGANQHADVVIVKSRIAPAEGQTLPGGDSGDIDAASADLDKEWQMDIENLAKALEDAEAKLDTLEKRTSDAEAALADAAEVIKSKEDEIAELQKGYKGKAAKSADADADDEDEDEDKKVMKSLPEPIRKRLEDFEKRAAEAEVALAKMRDEKDTAQAIAKAKTLNFGKAEEIGPLLMRVSKGTTTQADAEALERLFKAAGEQGKVTHLFKSIGSDTAVDGDPEVLLKAKADEIRKANSGMSFEQAYAQAMDSNPSLYNAYIAKRRAG